MRVSIALVVGVAIAGLAGSAAAEPAAGQQPNKAPVRLGQEATVTKATNDNVLVWSKTTIRVGMTKTEVLAQIEKSPKNQWFAVELDAPPYGELHKMDKWLLAYGTPGSPEQGGGTVTLIFAGDKLAKIERPRP